jgi:hypothetical protein
MDEHLGMELVVQHEPIPCRTILVLGTFMVHPLQQNTPEETIEFLKLHRAIYEAEYRIDCLT